jgi:hypothetical protein
VIDTDSMRYSFDVGGDNCRKYSKTRRESKDRARGAGKFFFLSALDEL